MKLQKKQRRGTIRRRKKKPSSTFEGLGDIEALRNIDQEGSQGFTFYFTTQGEAVVTL